jgi:arylsulfatase A-like enzyme
LSLLLRCLAQSCLLTGRNHQALGLSVITKLSIGYPAHNGYMGFEHGFLSGILLEHGYPMLRAQDQRHCKQPNFSEKLMV